MYYRIQNMFRISLVMFRYNFMDLWSIRLIIFMFLNNRTRNLENFKIIRNLGI